MVMVNCKTYIAVQEQFPSDFEKPYIREKEKIGTTMKLTKWT